MFGSLDKYEDKSLAIKTFDRVFDKYDKTDLSYVEKENYIFDDFKKNLQLLDVYIPDEEIKYAIHKKLYTLVTPLMTCYDDKKYKPWLQDLKAKINWKHKSQYFMYLLSKGWPLDTIKSIDEYTDEILDHIYYPKVNHDFVCRGLVIGDVQSGKTANYIGLINKAIDVEYKLIIVLSGTLSSLRTQTQARMNTDVLGYEPNVLLGSNEKVNIGLAADDVDYIDVESFTDKIKDWSSKTINKLMDDNMPTTIAVVKKNTKVLESIYNSISNNPKSIDGKINIPVLIIDDEVDQASVNTKKHEDEDPARINGWIRKIIMACNKVSYVGYTATPYANILINPDVNDDTYGKDLFPEDFIVVLPTPKNYCGIKKFFGTKENPNYDLVEIIRDDSNFFDAQIPRDEDFDDTLMDKKSMLKKNMEVEMLPKSAKAAIDDFIVASAVRRSREGDEIHNSMMFNISGFKKGSNSLKELVDNHVSKIKYCLKNEEFYNKYKKIWEDRFKNISQKRERFDDWNSIKKQLLYVINALDVLLLNGDSKDFINYTKTGQHEVIAVGGNKLSRGITLEGLMISYYLRKPNAYDTALQMGRWFGYKENYFDLCRIYTKSDTLEDFLTIFDATEELKEDIAIMNSRSLTPREFTLKVLTHPSFKPTSRNKMYSAEFVRVGFSEQRQETIRFDYSKKEENKKLTEQFIKGIEDKLVEIDKNTLVYKNISSSEVLSYLCNYCYSQDDSRGFSEQWKQYIRNVNKDGELLNWTVVVDSLDDEDAGEILLNDHKLYKAKRSKHHDNSYIRAISNPSDFKYFFEQNSEDRKRYNKGYKKGDDYLRTKFTKVDGLLVIYPIDIVDKDDKEKVLISDLIGFAIWFPYTNNKTGEAEYVVSKVEGIEIDEDTDEEGVVSE